MKYNQDEPDFCHVSTQIRCWMGRRYDNLILCFSDDGTLEGCQDL